MDMESLRNKTAVNVSESDQRDLEDSGLIVAEEMNLRISIERSYMDKLSFLYA